MVSEEFVAEAAKYHDAVDILAYKGKDFKNLSEEEILQFCKANLTFGEPGLSSEELLMLHRCVSTMNGRPITIVETGMCFGVSTRYFLIRNLKYGGKHTTYEIFIRPGFKEAMEELGLWQYLDIRGHSMKDPWEGQIDLLFIDSEHALSDALGEYMRFRVWLTGESIVAFHDSDTCYGVRRAIDMIQEIDDLELIGEIKARYSAGIKFFRVKGLGEKQVFYNRLYEKGELDGTRLPCDSLQALYPGA